MKTVSVPQPLVKGQKITAAFLNQLLLLCRENRVEASPPLRSFSGVDFGTRIEVDINNFAGSVTAILFGKSSGAWSSGTTISLTPCTIDGTATGTANVNAYVQVSMASYSMHNSTTVATGTIVQYVKTGAVYFVVGMPKVVLTAFNVDDANKKLQYKTRDDWGIFCGTESAYVDYTGAAC